MQRVSAFKRPSSEKNTGYEAKKKKDTKLKSQFYKFCLTHIVLQRVNNICKNEA
jgi:hypothetical protein